MLFQLTAVLCSSVGQYSQHWQVMRFVKWQHTIIQQVSSRDRCFGYIQFTVCDLRVGVNERLLINASDSFQITHVERILRAQITGMCGFDFTTRFVIAGFTLQSDYLCFCQLDTVTGHFFLQCFQPLFEVLKVMPQPDRTDTTS